MGIDEAQVIFLRRGCQPGFGDRAAKGAALPTRWGMGTFERIHIERRRVLILGVDLHVCIRRLYRRRHPFTFEQPLP